MRHALDERRFLSPQQRQTLLAIAETILPAGRVFPAAGHGTTDRVEQFVATLPTAVRHGYLALLRAVDAAALVRHRRRFTELDGERRLALLEGWQRGGVARRSALRALVTPIKIAHFDDPGFYRELGCVYEFDKPRPEPRPAWFRDRCHDGASLGGDVAVDCDVVVIGTGAGGAVVAKELAEAGLAVVLVEEGRYFDRTDFTGRPFAMQRQLYRNGGATFSVGNVAIPIPLGQTVGGTTTVNSGTCYRAPERVLRHWREDLGLTELTDEAMDGYFARVERVLGVAPTPPAILGGNARVIARGCEALGWTRHGPLRRNAPDCDGKGTCCFGCPTDAKRSTNVSYVPLALRAGAELFHGCAVERIVVADGRAAGVVARAGAHRLTVHARAVVVACGALLTPVLLHNNGLCGSSGELGGNLSIHPAAGCMAQFDEPINGWNGVPQGYAIEEFHEDGILFEGAQTPLEFAASIMPHVGPRLVELAEGFDRIASFGFMVEDTSRGRVRVVGGRPVVTYVLGDGDVARMKRGVEILARVFFAAGARSVITPVPRFGELRSPAELDDFRRSDLRASDFDMSAYHPLGTARMGRNPSRSVIGPDHQAHDVSRLYVVDGAAVPSSIGVNPQVTIMALATRAAEKIATALA